MALHSHFSSHYFIVCKHSISFFIYLFTKFNTLTQISLFQALSRESERKNDALVFPRFFLAHFRSYPTTESLEQAIHRLNQEVTDSVVINIISSLGSDWSSGWELVSSAAVFWDVMQRSPQRNGCSQPNNIPFHCVCGLVAVCWKDQSHNSKVRMTYAFALKGLRCGQCQCFCFTPTHATKNGLWPRATIMPYEKTNVDESPSTSASCAHRYVQLMREFIFSENVWL